MRRATWLPCCLIVLALSACQPYNPLAVLNLPQPLVTLPTVHTPPVAPPTTVLAEPEPVYESGACGGDLPPCWVMEAESGPGGNPTAVNESGCDGTGCFGKWQVALGTWNGYGGYSRADLAPESVQDDFARDLWDHGAGCGAWNAC